MGGGEPTRASDEHAIGADDDGVQEADLGDARRQAGDVAKIAPMRTPTVISEMQRASLIAAPLPARAGERRNGPCE